MRIRGGNLNLFLDDQMMNTFIVFGEIYSARLLMSSFVFLKVNLGEPVWHCPELLEP